MEAYAAAMVAIQTRPRDLAGSRPRSFRPAWWGPEPRGRRPGSRELHSRSKESLLKRGRPPHQDVLTPAEWRVLAYVQLGRSNARIASELGVSINTVRYHVANLLAKSETANRRELSAWRPLGLSGARREAPSFRGDRFAAVRTLLAEVGIDGLGASALDILDGVREVEPEAEAPSPEPLFTGTVVGVGEVVEREEETLAVGVGELLADVDARDWVAVNGVALRVAAEPTGASETRELRFVVPERVARRTNIVALKPGARVNLEPVSRVTDRMSGHILSGRVDGTATLRSLEAEGAAILASYEAPRELLRYIIEKGRVSVDGVSLAVAERRTSGFTVSLAPFTRGRTNLADRRLGEQVNVETDVLARYLERLMDLADQLADEGEQR